MKPAATPKGVVLSSPGRAEKLPAPGLARLLRGKSGSRSRARSSPMFVSRSKSAGRSSSSLEPALSEGGEPSSPKVTCIGQVRIRKKNKNRSSSSTTKTSPKSNRSDPSLRCRCLERSLLCKIFPRRKKKKKKKPSCYFCRPYRFFFCWRRKHKSAEEPSAAEAAPPIAFVREIKVETESEEEEEDEEDEETRVFVSSSSAGGVDGASATTHSPPKNALLLMRCGSAPHNRPSALALCRFPVSPIPASEIEEVKGEGIGERGRDSCNLSSKDEEEESRCSSTSQQQSPVGLMRCRSEPAKKAEKLMEVSYGKWTGSGGGSREGGLGMVRDAGPTPSPLPILLH